MPYSDASKDAMLDSQFVTGDLIALHSADPGAAGTTAELTGGGYTRQAAAYDAASGGTKLLNGTESFSVPAGDVSHFSIWDSAGTTFKGSGALSATETYAAAGTYDLTEITLTIT